MKERNCLLSVNNIKKYSNYENNLILKDITLDIYEGDRIAILGRTGSGKSTLMEILAGLDDNFQGGGRTLHNDLSTGIVFQQPMLMTWLTVWQNIQIGVASLDIEQSKKDVMVSSVIERMGLEGFEHHSLQSLSTGMKQRISIARSIVLNPDILFLDEAFTFIDSLTVESLWMDLLQSSSSRAMVFNSHKVEEAVEYADKIVVLSGSEITKTPSSIAGIVDCSFLGKERRCDSPEFQSMVDKIYSLITNDIKSEKGFSSALPMVDIDQMVGLLIHMHSFYHEGAMDLADLAEYADIDVEDIVDVIHCLSSLGFASVEGGRVTMTELGRALIEKSIDDRKDILAKAILQNVQLASILVQYLESKGELSYREAISILEKIYCTKERGNAAYLNIFLKWAVYAEILDYDEKQKLILKKA